MTKKIIETAIITIFLMNALVSLAQDRKSYNAIYSGLPWMDNRGKAVSAHGANIIKDNGKYYLFGEYKTDSANVFNGFSCYSSVDLYNWKFERIALPVQTAGKLGANRVGERPKVMKCPNTGEYIMYMHVDTLGYIDQFIGYATSKTITGPYIFQGPLLFNGEPIRKWDMGTFQDQDGLGYVLIHGGEIYKLAEDYKSVVEKVNESLASGFESPTLFRKDSLYYFLGSNLTSWERNDNYYFTATSLHGPWEKRGVFAPEGTLTWNSQCTFVLPIEGTKDTTYMYMGDRWSFPKQASAATYVWQPLIVSDSSLSIPVYQEAWKIDISHGMALPTSFEGKIIKSADKNRVRYVGNWAQDTLFLRSSDMKGASFSTHFQGTQVAFYGMARPEGGYALVKLQNSNGKTVLSSIVDMYCKYPISALKFLSPRLPKDHYTLTVTVMGERGNWSDKRKSLYGSTGNMISLDKLIIDTSK
ncbi:family 43 glycosylhydrolase [Olivibacter domesticus]|uniref:Glycosyl hydrolases family 43 n=1 Tax=Olivibacter domesticus TaxID=407022 RepID=A0A1H7Z8U6_OLID1|nr:family 43 glycosylhydrolase [Olivibacter domesticus]SEM54685.1 Glycosyl hydrolases family 43 [Olivibacter domesticus]